MEDAAGQDISVGDLVVFSLRHASLLRGKVLEIRKVPPKDRYYSSEDTEVVIQAIGDVGKPAYKVRHKERIMVVGRL